MGKMPEWIEMKTGLQFCLWQCDKKPYLSPTECDRYDGSDEMETDIAASAAAAITGDKVQTIAICICDRHMCDLVSLEQVLLDTLAQ